MLNYIRYKEEKAKQQGQTEVLNHIRNKRNSKLEIAYYKKEKAMTLETSAITDKKAKQPRCPNCDSTQVYARTATWICRRCTHDWPVAVKKEEGAA
jgi:transposase-like protein